MTDPTAPRRAAVVVCACAVAVLAVALASPATASRPTNPRIVVNETTPGATATHVFSFGLDEATADGTEIDAIVVDYGDGSADLTRVAAEDVTIADGSGHLWNSSDVAAISVSNAGSRLRLTTRPNANVSVNDEERIILRYEGVLNPTRAGSYEVTMRLIDDGRTFEVATATLTVGDPTVSATAVPTTDPSTSATAASDSGSHAVPTSSGASTSMTSHTSTAGSGGSPGFGVAVAALALLAVAGVATRRR